MGTACAEGRDDVLVSMVTSGEQPVWGRNDVSPCLNNNKDQSFEVYIQGFAESLQRCLECVK